MWLINSIFNIFYSPTKIKNGHFLLELIPQFITTYINNTYQKKIIWHWDLVYYGLLRPIVWSLLRKVSHNICFGRLWVDPSLFRIRQQDYLVGFRKISFSGQICVKSLTFSYAKDLNSSHLVESPVFDPSKHPDPLQKQTYTTAKKKKCLQKWHAVW